MLAENCRGLANGADGVDPRGKVDREVVVKDAMKMLGDQKREDSNEKARSGVDIEGPVPESGEEDEEAVGVHPREDVPPTGGVDPTVLSGGKPGAAARTGWEEQSVAGVGLSSGDSATFLGSEEV